MSGHPALEDILHCTGSICYVDDLNILSSSKHELVKAMEVLWDFVRAMKLRLSCAKSYLWGTHGICPARTSTGVGC